MKLPKTLFAGVLLTVVVAALLAQDSSPSSSGTTDQPVQSAITDVGTTEAITTSAPSGATLNLEVRQSGTSGAVSSTLVSEGAFDDGTGRLPPPINSGSPPGADPRGQNPANLGNGSAFMFEMMRGAGQAPDLARQFRDVNEESVQIARRYRDLAEREPSSPQLEAERQSLVNAVAGAFDVRQRWQQEEVARLQERLKRLENTIASRNRGRNQIIERRVAELLNPEQVWGDSPADSDRSTRPASSRPMLPPDAHRGDDVHQNSVRRSQLLIGSDRPSPVGRINSDSRPGSSKAGGREDITATSSDGTSVHRDASSSSSGSDLQLLIESVDALGRARTALAESQTSLATEQTNVERWQQFSQSDPNSVQGGQLRSAENALHRAQNQMRRAEDDLKSATRQERQARLALETRIRLLVIDLESAKLKLDQAKREEDRARILHDRAAIPQGEYEEKQTAHRQAQLGIQKAETLLNAAQQSLKAADEYAQPASNTGTRLDRVPGTGDAPRSTKRDAAPATQRLDPPRETQRLDSKPGDLLLDPTTPPGSAPSRSE